MTGALEETKVRFLKDVAEHELRIELDDGTHKHLRFGKPGTMMYSFSIVTWPGYLAIAGDIPTFVFKREEDMFAFWEKGGPTPDPVYLSGKLSGDFTTKRYSEDQFKREARRWLQEQLDQEDDPNAREYIRMGVENDLVRRVPQFREEAMPMLETFEVEHRRIQDPWEWDLEEWDAGFLWCLWAITWGITRYREQTA